MWAPKVSIFERIDCICLNTSQIWFQANFDLSLVDSLFPFSLSPYCLWISDVKRQRKLEENQPRLKKLNLNNLFWNFNFDQCNIYSCILAHQIFFSSGTHTFNKSCLNHLTCTLVQHSWFIIDLLTMLNTPVSGNFNNGYSCFLCSTQYRMWHRSSTFPLR